MSRPFKPAHDVFDALSNPLRRRILEVLHQHGEQPVSALLERFPIGQPTMSHHLKRLRQVKLVTARSAGQARIYRFCPEALAPAQRWVLQHGTKKTKTAAKAT